MEDDDDAIWRQIEEERARMYGAAPTEVRSAASAADDAPNSAVAEPPRQRRRGGAAAETVETIADGSWTGRERTAFFRALRRYSRFLPELISEDIGSKSAAEVETYLCDLHRFRGLLGRPPKCKAAEEETAAERTAERRRASRLLSAELRIARRPEYQQRAWRLIRREMAESLRRFLRPIVRAACLFAWAETDRPAAAVSAEHVRRALLEHNCPAAADGRPPPEWTVEGQLRTAPPDPSDGADGAASADDG